DAPHASVATHPSRGLSSGFALQALKSALTTSPPPYAKATAISSTTQQACVTFAKVTPHCRGQFLSTPGSSATLPLAEYGGVGRRSPIVGCPTATSRLVFEWCSCRES